MQEWVSPTRPAMALNQGRSMQKETALRTLPGDTAWVIRRTGYDPDTAARDESLFALANGALGVRGGIDEAPSLTDATFLADFFEQAPIHYHEKLAGFARS